MIHTLVSGVDADPGLMTVVKEPLNDAAAILRWLNCAPVFEHSLEGVEAVSVLRIDELRRPSSKV